LYGYFFIYYKLPFNQKNFHPKDIDENGIDVISNKISGHFAWFRGLELAFTLNRLRDFNVLQEGIDEI
jgi:hypothetical protein